MLLCEPLGSLAQAARLSARVSLAYDDLPMGRRTEESCLSGFRFGALRTHHRSGSIHGSPPNIRRYSSQTQDFDVSVPGDSVFIQHSSSSHLLENWVPSQYEGLKDVSARHQHQEPNVHTHTHPLQLYPSQSRGVPSTERCFFLKGLYLTETPL